MKHMENKQNLKVYNYIDKKYYVHFNIMLYKILRDTSYVKNAEKAIISYLLNYELLK